MFFLAFLFSYSYQIPKSSGAVLSYSTYLGSATIERAGGGGKAVAVDITGSAYVTGDIFSNGFPVLNPIQGTFQGGGSDAFVTKFSPSGSSLIYSTYLGGGGSDRGNSIAVDPAGSAYITGYVLSVNFPTVNPYQATFGGGGSDAFVAKISSTGTALDYSTYLGGATSDNGFGVTADLLGNAYITGYADSTNFPTSNPYQGTYAISVGTNDAFVTKLTPDGTALVFSTYLGGTGDDRGYGIDYACFIMSCWPYVSGFTDSDDFPTASPYQGTRAGNYDAFVTQLLLTGTDLVYSTYIGGSLDDKSYALDLDDAANAYVAGTTSSSNYPTQNPFQGTAGGGNDIFATKLSPSGTSLEYSTYIGKGGVDEGYGIVVNSSGNAYLTGHTTSATFPVLNPYQSTFSAGGEDSYATKLSPSGNSLSYSTFLGGTGSDKWGSIAVDSSGNAYITGTTNSSNFPTLNPYQGTYAGGGFDVFLSKLRIPLATVGIFRPSTSRFYLRNSNSGGPADLNFTFGTSTDLPLTGNWDGDNDTTVGIYRPSNRTYYLKNANSGGAADMSFVYGATGDTPISGDWDGNGNTTIGSYRSSNRTFYLRNANSGGSPDMSFVFGGTGDTPILGDWDGDGDTTCGVYRSTNRTFYLRNSNSAGSADVTVVFGATGDTPFVGDWDGDGIDTIGVFRASTSIFFLRNSNSGGVADLSFAYGSSADKPIRGDWNGE